MPYRAPNAYAQFVRTAGPVSNAGSTRVMGIIGTGLTYYEVYNEAIDKDTIKPYDVLANSNVFNIISISSSPITSNKISPTNVIYDEGTAFTLQDGNKIAWSTISTPSQEIIAATPAATAWQSLITVLPDTANSYLTENGEYLVEVIYVEDQDTFLNSIHEGAYRVINNLTQEIIGEYGVSPNEVGGIIPGFLLKITDTYVASQADGSSVVNVGDYVIIKTVAGKTEISANATFTTGSSYSAALQSQFEVLNPQITNPAEQIQLMIVDDSSVVTGNFELSVVDATAKTIKITQIGTTSNTIIYGPALVNAVPEYLNIIPGITFLLTALPSTAVTGDKVRISTTAMVPGVAPAQQSTYYVSYKYHKATSDYDPQIFSNYDDVVAEYGNYAVTPSSVVINSLSLAAEIAFQNGLSQIVCVQVAKDNDDLAMQAAIDKLQTNLPGVNNINTVIPMTTSDVIGAYLMNHVNLMSSEDHAMERMGYLGARINQLITKNPTALDLTVGMIQQAQSYFDERIVYVVPGEVNREVRDLMTGLVTTVTLPACYMAVAVAALGLVNDPAEPLTRKSITGFKNLPRLLAESEKNSLAAAGCCVIEQKGSVIRVRHGITTETDDVNSQEITLIQIKDYVIDACRRTCGDLYIGNKNNPSIVSDIQYTITSILNQFITQDVILGYQGLSVKRSPDDPREVDVRFEIEAVYPLNYINITFGFATT